MYSVRVEITKRNTWILIGWHNLRSDDRSALYIKAACPAIQSMPLVSRRHPSLDAKRNSTASPSFCLKALLSCLLYVSGRYALTMARLLCLLFLVVAALPASGINVTVPSEGETYSLTPGPSAIQWEQQS